MINKHSFKFLATALAVVSVGAMIDAANNSAHATCVEEPYLGSICATAATYCPRGYQAANGQLLSTNEFSALYSLMGAIYGGDGRLTFGLPDLRGRSIVSSGMGPGLSPYPQGRYFGAEDVVIDIKQLPTHDHDAVFTGTGGGSGGDASVFASTANATKSSPSAGDLLAATVTADRTPAPTFGYVPEASAGTTVPLGGVTGGGGGITGGIVQVGAIGESEPLTILPPRMTLLYCVAVEGTYPVRPR